MNRITLLVIGRIQPAPPATFSLFAFLIMAYTPTGAQGVPLVIESGQTHIMNDDLVLDGDDTLQIHGTPEKPCVLVSNRHRIYSGPKWTGSLTITHTTIRDLGGLPKRTADGLISGPGTPALDLKIAGKGSVRIEHCTLHACSAIRLQTDGSSTASFRNNTILENSAVAISKDIANSGDCFTATGNSRERKLFQGNFIPRGKVIIRASNWLVGGDRDADSNLFIGYRIGIVADGEETVVRGNYFHLRMPITKEFPYWSQISVASASGWTMDLAAMTFRWGARSTIRPIPNLRDQFRRRFRSPMKISKLARWASQKCSRRIGRPTRRRQGAP